MKTIINDLFLIKNKLISKKDPNAQKVADAIHLLKDIDIKYQSKREKKIFEVLEYYASGKNMTRTFRGSHPGESDRYEDIDYGSRAKEALIYLNKGK